MSDHDGATASAILPGADPFSTREGQLDRLLTATHAVEAVRLAASGAHNRELAERLVVSEKTVRYHLGQTYAP